MIPTLQSITLMCQITLNPLQITQTPSLAEFPFGIVEVAIDTVKSLFIRGDSDVWPAVLLLTGIFNIDVAAKIRVLLPWSPLREIAADIITEDYFQLAKTWLLNKMSSAILAFDEKARALWKVEWPLRCARFLAKGRIPNGPRVLLGKLIPYRLLPKGTAGRVHAAA
jgi:hypothetical protein